jgi:hypothetical protein
MRVEDYDSRCEVADPADIDAVLSKRHGDGLNSFWLSHGAEDFPAINIPVRGELTYVHYFPKHRHPGFASAAKVPGPRSNETRIFFRVPERKNVGTEQRADPLFGRIESSEGVRGFRDEAKVH